MARSRNEAPPQEARKQSTVLLKEEDTCQVLSLSQVREHEIDRAKAEALVAELKQGRLNLAQS